jgi:hypothetical protein
MGIDMAEDQGTDPVLSKIDPEKRQFIGKLIGTTAFVAPLVASFAMGNLTISDALAANGSLPS